MKNIGTVIAAAILAIVLALYMCTYQVRFTEVAIKKTWGKAAAAPITEAGLRFKWPAPIQEIVVYDSRIRVLDDTTEETRTKDGDNLILTTYTLWKIVNAGEFHTNFPSGDEAGRARLKGLVRTHKKTVTGNRNIAEFISTNPNDRKLREIEQEMLALVQSDARREYGIEVVDLGIKKLLLPESVTTAIFDKMKSTEQAKADRYLAEGAAAAQDIVARATATRGRIMAVAQQKVVEIESDAKRVIGEHYKEFHQYPELRIFLDEIRSLKESLRERTTLILDTATPPYNLFTKEAREQPVAARESSTTGADTPAEETRSATPATDTD